MSLTEILQIISLIFVIPMNVFALLTLISKPFRDKILSAKTAKKKDAENEKNQNETDRCLLRDRITSIYFKHVRECEIKEYEFENMEHLYKQYKKLGGNSFVDKIWREVQDWHVIR